MGFLSGLPGGGSMSNQPWVIPIHGDAPMSSPKPGAAEDGEKGSGIDLASLFAMLGGAQQQPPAPQPQWAPPPAPRFLGELQNAPRMGQRQMMAPPMQMQPYLWGGR